MLASVTRRQRVLLLGLLLIVVAFSLGWMARGWSAPQVLVGSGYVGDDVATLFVGQDAYGLRSSVTWTDADGSYHASGWPDCLPHLQEVSGVRFTGETVWAGGVVGGIGSGQIIWVDCGLQRSIGSPRSALPDRHRQRHRHSVRDVAGHGAELMDRAVVAVVGRAGRPGHFAEP